MTPEIELLQNAVEWQLPVAFCIQLGLFSLAFITVNSIT